MRRIILPPTLDFTRLMRACGGTPPDTPPEDVAVDFQLLRFVTPQGMVAMACLLDRWLEEGSRIELANAPRCVPFQYLQRMDFFSLFGVFREEQFARRRQKGRFAAMREVSQQADTKQVATDLANSLSQETTFDLVRGDLHNCLYESVNNIVDHARLGGKRGFAVAQSYLRGRDREYTIAVADAGRGIAAALRDNEDLTVPNDITALDLACRPGVTGAKGYVDEFGNPRNVGQGLFQIDQIAQSVDGKFILCSGSASRVRVADQFAVSSREWNWHGTLVIVTLTYGGMRRYVDSLAPAGRIRLA